VHSPQEVMRRRSNRLNRLVPQISYRARGRMLPSCEKSMLICADCGVKVPLVSHVSSIRSPSCHPCRCFHHRRASEALWRFNGAHGVRSMAVSCLYYLSNRAHRDMQLRDNAMTITGTDLRTAFPSPWYVQGERVARLMTDRKCKLTVGFQQKVAKDDLHAGWC